MPLIGPRPRYRARTLLLLLVSYMDYLHDATACHRNGAVARSRQPASRTKRELSLPFCLSLLPFEENGRAEARRKIQRRRGPIHRDSSSHRSIRPKRRTTEDGIRRGYRGGGQEVKASRRGKAIRRRKVAARNVVLAGTLIDTSEGAEGEVEKGRMIPPEQGRCMSNRG